MKIALSQKQLIAEECPYRAFIHIQASPDNTVNAVLWDEQDEIGELAPGQHVRGTYRGKLYLAPKTAATITVYVKQYEYDLRTKIS